MKNLNTTVFGAKNLDLHYEWTLGKKWNDKKCML